MEKGLGKNGMNVACGMGMSILLMPSGAEVYACSVSKMKCKGYEARNERRSWNEMQR
ncbi:MAG: hypothetical protein GZ091_08725 [Paludibacter sp.]|nr:hypothetical protein [Paludibacter sp.]